MVANLQKNKCIKESVLATAYPVLATPALVLMMNFVL